MFPPEDTRKVGGPANVFVSVVKLGRKADELHLGLVPGLERSLVQSHAQLEGDSRIVLGVKNENRAGDH